MQALTDNPVENPEDDKYGFGAFASILAGMIVDTDQLPFCMGIFGPWGTGKSSLMKLIEHSLKQNDDIKTIWFNPWKYHRREELWSALIRAVLTKIAEGGNEQSKSLAKKLLKSAAWSAIKRASGPLTLGIVNKDDIESVKEAFAASEQEYQRYVNSFEDDFSNLVNKYTKSGKLVIFVDDLDRCLPESAITVLESLKLFIGHAQCVFVLGMDKTIVEMGIQKQYGHVVKITGRDYLDKIIQVPFYVPPVPFGKLKASIRVAKTADYPAAVWHILEHGMTGNPRKTKRFVNSFYLLRQILSAPEADPSLQGPASSDGHKLPLQQQDIYLAKLLVLQLVFPLFYEYLVDHPDGWNIFESKILAGNVEQRKTIYLDYPELKDFEADPVFKRFMGMTAKTPALGIPVAPDERVVSQLMRAINLVSDESRSSRGPKSGSSRSSAKPRAKVRR